MARKTASVKGEIVTDDNAWFYEWMGIQHTTAAKFKAELDEAGPGDTVVVEVNSPGGAVSEGAEIYEAIRTFKGDIEVHVVGMAASCASFIACAARSTISPMGYLFLHNCLTSCAGNQHAMRQTMETLASIDENIMSAYQAKTGMGAEDIYALMEQNTTISAKRAVELGFIDEISEDAPAPFAAGSGAAGIAAALPGMFGIGSIGADKMAELRDAYVRAHVTEEGGKEMENMTDQTEEALEAGEPNGEAEETGTEEVDVAEACDDADGQAAGDAGEPVDRYEEGVLAERARVEGILAIADGIDEEAVRDALFANPVDARDLAFRALFEGRQRAQGSYMAKAKADAAASNASEVAAAIGEEKPSAVDAVAAMMKKLNTK